MARVGRLSGAMLVHSGSEFYLVGDTKVPCNWAAAGFEPPGEIDARLRPFIRLSPLAARAASLTIAAPYLTLELEGEPLARLLAERLVVQRTGLVSERLWRLITSASEDDDAPAAEVTDARWLGEIPLPLWQIVRDTVLRCS
jgi:hypothetical protein